MPIYQTNSDLYANLTELALGTFPKQCNYCGITYKTVDEFVLATLNIHPNRSGLKQGFDDDGKVIIELFRNCRCGSTLMDVFHSRRDVSAEGSERRKQFDQLVIRLGENGVQVMEAKVVILKWIRGQDCDLGKMLKIERLAQL
jgi:hypothetical protein